MPLCKEISHHFDSELENLARKRVEKLQGELKVSLQEIKRLEGHRNEENGGVLNPDNASGATSVLSTYVNGQTVNSGDGEYNMYGVKNCAETL